MGQVATRKGRSINAGLTGGVEAIRQVLSSLGPACPPIVIAQHMPGGFTARFAARLNDEQVAEVVNYVRTHFGNQFTDAVKADDVKLFRK